MDRRLLVFVNLVHAKHRGKAGHGYMRWQAGLADQENESPHFCLKQVISRTEIQDRVCSAVLDGLMSLEDKIEATMCHRTSEPVWPDRSPRTFSQTATISAGAFSRRRQPKNQGAGARSLLRRARCQQDGKDDGPKQDLPFEERTMHHLLYGGRRVMTDWGYDKAVPWANPEKGKLSLRCERVLYARCRAGCSEICYSKRCEEVLNADMVADFIALLLNIHHKQAKICSKTREGQRAT